VTQTANPIGFEIIGDSAEPRLIGCQAAGQNVGVLVNTTSTSSNVSISDSNFWECDSHGVLISDGKCSVSGSVFRGGTMSGVTPNNTDLCRITNNTFDTIGGTAIASTSVLNPVIQSGNIFNSVGATIANPYKPTIASADPLVPTPEFNGFTVTGTTDFGSISNAEVYAGKTIVLTFEGVLTVFDGTFVNIAGDYVTSANDTLTLYSDGTNWYQVARSAN
jgi:hypothetical protein